MSESFEINIPCYGAHPEKGSLVAWNDILPILKGLRAHIERLESDIEELKMEALEQMEANERFSDD